MDTQEKERTERFNGKALEKLIHHRKSELMKSNEIKSLEEIKEELSHNIGVSVSALKHWIHGRHKPGDYSIVLALAKEFNVSPEYFEISNNEKDTVISMTNNNEAATEINNLSPAYSKNIDSISAVYANISDFLESYRVLDFGTGSAILTEKFNTMYRNFKKTRIEIPKSIYEKLEEFMTQYLFMIIGIDYALPLYLKDLESLHEDAHDFIFQNASFPICTMTKTIWPEYLKLKNLILIKNQCITEYIDPLEDLYLTYFFENDDDESVEEYTTAAIFMKDLYSWLDSMFTYCIDEFTNFFDLFNNNPKIYKATCIHNAYYHLDKILSLYIK